MGRAEDRRAVNRGSETRYREEAECLCAAILEVCASGSDWTEGLIAGLRTILNFVAEEPVKAQELLALGRNPGEGAVQLQMVERLTRALDGARRLPGSRHSAPPLTAALMIGAVENLVRGLLAAGESDRAPSLLGDLTYLIVLSYFGEDAAFAAMDKAKG